MESQNGKYNWKNIKHAPLKISNLRILVTGVTGQLGYDVCKELKKRNIQCIGTGSKDFDITNPADTENFIKKYEPAAVIHCAAYTAVDKAEDERERCFAVNAEGTRNIAQVCKELDCKMIYISTDYVFPGIGENYYEISDETRPQNVYGQSKLAGELAVKEQLHKYFIVRISWVFGENGNNFIKTMLRIGKDKETVNVVSDQIGSPTYTADLAPLLCDMVMSEKYGTYHASNEGVCSWAELAEETFRAADYKTKVNHITTAEYPTKAVRPQNSKMSKASLENAGFSKLPEWRDAVNRYIKDL